VTVVADGLQQASVIKSRRDEIRITDLEGLREPATTMNILGRSIRACSVAIAAEQIGRRIVAHRFAVVVLTLRVN
jgi:hypothetical protein